MDSHPKLTVNGPNEKRVTTLHVQPVAPSPSSILTSSDPTLWDTQFADSARQWTTATKVAISVVAIVSFFVITLANSIYIAGIPGVRAEFQIGTTLAISPVALYAMGFAIGPLLSSALSEKFGRKWAIKCSLLLHLIFTIVGAIAPNFRTLAVARALSGILGSPLVTIFVGVLNDLWKMPEDHLAVPVFLLYGLGGISAPTVGPVIGQAVVENGGWRWTFWLIAILVGLCFLAAIPIEETYEPVVRRKASNIPGRDWQNVVGRAFLRPLHMLWVERIIWPTTSITVAGQVVLFVFYAAFPIMLDEVYEFTPYETGLAFLAQLVAGVLAFPVLGFIERKGRASAKRDPEFILDGGKLAGTAMWTSLIIIAWLPRNNVHWVWVIMASAVFGFGFALSQLVYARYKNEVYRADLGVSVLAIDVSLRYALSCVFPLFTVQLMDRVGFHWMMSLLAALHLALSIIPWALQKKGATLRAQSPYLNRHVSPHEDAARTIQSP